MTPFSANESARISIITWVIILILIIKITSSSIVIGLKNFYFPLIHLSSVIGQFVIGHLVIGQFVIRQFNKPITLKVINKLLDEVFVISRIIKVEVRVISRSRRLRLITLTETLIILDITKTESNNCFIIHWTQKLGSHVSASSLTASNTSRAKLAWFWSLEIMHCGHTWHDYSWPLTWLPVTLTWLLYNLQVMTSRALISKIHCTLFGQSEMS